MWPVLPHAPQVLTAFVRGLSVGTSADAGTFGAGVSVADVADGSDG